MTAYAYRGIDRQGVGRAGRTAEVPAELVARLYRAGWRRLTVTLAGRNDTEVGWITRDIDTGGRVWSADTTV